MGREQFDAAEHDIEQAVMRLAIERIGFERLQEGNVDVAGEGAQEIDLAGGFAGHIGKAEAGFRGDGGHGHFAPGLALGKPEGGLVERLDTSFVGHAPELSAMDRWRQLASSRERLVAASIASSIKRGSPFSAIST